MWCSNFSNRVLVIAVFCVLSVAKILFLSVCVLPDMATRPSRVTFLYERGGLCANCFIVFHMRTFEHTHNTHIHSHIHTYICKQTAPDTSRTRENWIVHVISYHIHDQTYIRNLYSIYSYNIYLELNEFMLGILALADCPNRFLLMYAFEWGRHIYYLSV